LGRLTVIAQNIQCQQIPLTVSVKGQKMDRPQVLQNAPTLHDTDSNNWSRDCSAGVN